MAIAWTQLIPTTTPIARGAHLMVYDSAKSRVMFWGGWNNERPGPYLPEVWYWDAGNWVSLSLSGFIPNAEAACFGYYAPTQDRLIVYGGEGANWFFPNSYIHSLDPSSGVWTRAHYAGVGGGNSLVGTAWHNFGVYMTAHGLGMTFNGWSMGFEDYRGPRTSISDPAASGGFTTVVASGEPGARGSCAMAYDSARDKVVVFGGELSPENRNPWTPTPINETWEYDHLTAAWTQKAPATIPPARVGASMCYAAGAGMLLMYGGWDGGGTYYDDLWSWDGTDWALVLAGGPGARMHAGFAYDPGAARVILFGGESPWKTYLSDTWALDVPSIPGYILNPSFELAASQDGAAFISIPASWEESTFAGAARSADFGPPYRWTESYEALWQDNHLALSELTAADVIQFVFGWQTPTDADDLFYEGYERDWSNNQNALDEFEPTVLSPAMFHDGQVEVEDYEQQWLKRHPQNDTRHITDDWLPSASDPPKLYAIMNEMRAKYEAHRQDAAVHTAADAVNVITAPECGDTPSTIALSNDLWDKAWDHMVDPGDIYHLTDSGASMEGQAWIPPVITTLSGAAYHAVWLMLSLNAHFTWLDLAGPLAFDSFSDVFLPGDDIYRALVEFRWEGAAPETYEHGWRDNENILSELAPGDLSGFLFTAWSGDTDTETYDDAMAILPAPGAGNYGSPFEFDETGEVRAAFTGVGFTGEVEFQTRRGSGANFVTRASLTTVPIDMDLLAGTTAVRLHTVTINGSFQLGLYWKPIETL